LYHTYTANFHSLSKITRGLSLWPHQVSLNTLRDTAGISLEAVGDKPLYTLNDWVYESLGRPPKSGDTIDSDCCQNVVRKTRNVMVQEAFLLSAKATET
jgi:CBS domain containing-hemolysin-like protein